jgi:hypothetical protein
MTKFKTTTPVYIAHFLIVLNTSIIYVHGSLNGHVLVCKYLRAMYLGKL